MSSIAEKFKIAKIIQNGRLGNSTTEVGYLPTNGVDTISIVCGITTGHGTAQTLTLATANDAAGTSTAVLSANVPVYLNNVRQADAKAVTIPDTYFAAGLISNTAVFEVPASLVPAGKYLGIKCDAGNAGNVYSAIAVEDTYYKG